MQLKNVKSVLFASLSLLTGCAGYHLEGTASQTVNVPYVRGDLNGNLTDSIIRELAQSGKYTIQEYGADLELNVEVIANDIYKAGFQYDEEGSREYNRLVTNEEQRHMTLSVTLIDAKTKEVIKGPGTVSASINYDFIDPDSDDEAAVRRRLSTLNFSLGQMDSVEGARSASTVPLHTLLARKLASAL